MIFLQKRQNELRSSFDPMKECNGSHENSGRAQHGALGLLSQWLLWVIPLPQSGTACSTWPECVEVWLNRLATLMVVLFMGTLGYWAQDRSPPITVKTETVSIDAEKAYVRISYAIERHRQCSLVLEQILYDAQGDRMVVPPQIFPIAPGSTGPDSFGIKIHIPEGFSRGRARYRAIRLYTCNPVQRILNWPIVLNVPDIQFDYDP